MVTGIVLVNVERAMIQTVIEDLGQDPGVAEIYAVAGEYDLVVIIPGEEQRRSRRDHRVEDDP